MAQIKNPHDHYAEMQALLDRQIRRKRKISPEIKKQLLAFSKAFAAATCKVGLLAYAEITEGSYMTIHITNEGALERIHIPLAKQDGSKIELSINCRTPESLNQEVLADTLRLSGIGF